MGIYGVAMAAASDLWGCRSLCGFQVLCMGLRCQTYGALWGIQISIVAAFLDLWGVWNCGARPMVIYGESALLLWLRSWTYGLNLWGYKSRTNRKEDQ